jgi:hypothetical protein
MEMIMEMVLKIFGLSGILLCLVIPIYLYFYLRHRNSAWKAIYDRLLTGRHGTIEFKWLFGMGVKIPINGDMAFVDLHQLEDIDIELRFIVDSSHFKNYIGFQIYNFQGPFSSQLKSQKQRIFTGNQRFDDEFLITEGLWSKRSRGELLKKVTPELQESILHLKQEIPNSSISIGHLENSKRFWITVEYPFISSIVTFLWWTKIKVRDLSQINRIIDQSISIYQLFRSLGRL